MSSLGSTPADDSLADRIVRKRTVFYIAGFDPQGPSHYYHLFKSQAAAQTRVTDYRLNVGPRIKTEPLVSSWTVDFESSTGERVANTYQFLRWDDIVREHWPRGRWRLMRVTVSASLKLFLNGSWLSMCRVSWVAGLTLALPLGLGLLACGISIAALVTLLFVATQPASALGAAGSLAVSVALLAAAAALPRLWRHGQGDWLMRSTASLLRYACGRAPEIEERIGAWAQHLAASFEDDQTDEVLIIAHSSGCIAAVSAVHQALEISQGTGGQRASISVLTLGQCIPMMSHQPQAIGFRRRLEELGRSTRIRWVDVTAPPDACCFALTDPCASPYRGDLETSSVKRLSPRYAEQMSAEAYRTVKADKFRCHFQYLMAFEHPQHYDFFEWVSGPKTLRVRTHAQKSIVNFNRFKW